MSAASSDIHQDRRMRNVSPSMSPTPIRVRSDLVSNRKDDDLVLEVFTLLREKNANFNEDTNEALKQLLNRHALRTEGIAKG